LAAVTKHLVVIRLGVLRARRHGWHLQRPFLRSRFPDYNSLEALVDTDLSGVVQDAEKKHGSSPTIPSQ